jgi:hypothetical protein
MLAAHPGQVVADRKSCLSTANNDRFNILWHAKLLPLRPQMVNAQIRVLLVQTKDGPVRPSPRHGGTHRGDSKPRVAALRKP